MLYRWALVAYFLSWLVVNGMNSGPRFFIYLTEWSYLVWCSYLITSATSTSIRIIKRSRCCQDAHPAQGITDTPSYMPVGRDEDEPCQQAGAEEFETPPSTSVSQGLEGLHIERDCRNNATRPSEHNMEIPQQDRGGMLVKVQWILFYVGINSAIFVTLLFWILVYGLSQDITKSELTPGIYHAHGVNAFFAIIDIILTGIPMRALHLVFPVCFGIAYAVFSVIYYSAHGTDAEGNRYVYSALDWSKPGPAIGVLLLSVVVQSLVYVFMYLVYKLRERLLSCIKRTSPQASTYVA